MRRDFTDLDFTVVAELATDFRCEFTVYSIMGTDSDGVLLWTQDDEHGAPQPVDSLEEADVYLRGEIKWDGCSNWYFDEQDRVMIQFCSKGAAKDIGTLFERMYDIAKEVIPKWMP
jgi:hypothetical protein